MDYYLTANGLMDESTYLMHYGVPGMKWGVRKQRGGNFLQRLGYRQANSRMGQLGLRMGQKRQQKKLARQNMSEADIKKANRRKAIRRAALGAAGAAGALALYNRVGSPAFQKFMNNGRKYTAASSDAARVYGELHGLNEVRGRGFKVRGYKKMKQTGKAFANRAQEMRRHMKNGTYKAYRNGMKANRYALRVV